MIYSKAISLYPLYPLSIRKQIDRFLISISASDLSDHFLNSENNKKITEKQRNQT